MTTRFQMKENRWEHCWGKCKQILLLYVYRIPRVLMGNESKSNQQHYTSLGDSHTKTKEPKLDIQTQSDNKYNELCTVY